MFYLIVYDRQTSNLKSLETFSDDQGDLAFEKKLEYELAYAEGNHVEVAMLQGDDESVLRRTHARYFSNIKELIEDVRQAVGAAKNA